MSQFDVSADAYVRFMGRFSSVLAGPFADVGLRGVPSSAAVLDVGCGPGMLTAELARRQGESRVSAVDPEQGFAEATAAAFPASDVHQAPAEHLPFTDGSFGATLAQLVVQFMSDPVAGLAEMARVTAAGGRVSACVWDFGGGTGALSGFWRTAMRTDPDATGEGERPGTTAGDLTRLFTLAGLRDVQESVLTVAIDFPTFEDWWQPFTLGVGPAGVYVASLDAAGRARLEADLRSEYGDGPFTIHAGALTATGTVAAPA